MLTALLRPWPLLSILFVLIASQLFYAFLPYRRRNYLAVLLLTAIGFGLGQLWEYLGLPSFAVGEANLLPALVAALALQPLASRLPINLRKERG